MALGNLIFTSCSMRASSSGEKPSCDPDILPNHPAKLNPITSGNATMALA